MYSKNKLEPRYIVLIVLGLSAIMLGIITGAVQDKRKLNPVEQAIKDSVIFVNNIINAPIKWVSDQIKITNDKNNLYHKYQDLLKKSETVELDAAKRVELESEIKKLKETLKLNKTLAENTYLNATIINRNLGYWYNTITIDKGASNGIKIDMAVISKDGLVGKIIKTTNYNSTVKLLTTEDVNNKISVKIQVGSEFIYGLLSGYNIKNKTFIVEGISSNIGIPSNSLVMTTGLGGLFPSGILVGYVTSFTTDNFDLAKIVEVKSKVNFDDLSYVTVLKRADQ